MRHPGQLIGPAFTDAWATGAGRFAPSTSGPPHLGTLASALLVWLDARQRGVEAFLRLEDLDPGRAKAQFAAAIVATLDHLGLSFDHTAYQSQSAAWHARALDTLAARGLLYACDCTRATVIDRTKRVLGPAPSALGGYDNFCRRNPPLARDAWRRCPEAVRVRLPDCRVAPVDLGGRDLEQIPAAHFGDPTVRRRDGSVAYILASVVDDSQAQVGHIVRGADLAPLSATQVLLMRLLSVPEPTFRHHPILLEPSGRKWSKSRQTKAGASAHVDFLDQPAPALLGQLAFVLGLQNNAAPTLASTLLARFAWHAVIAEDVVVTPD